MKKILLFITALSLFGCCLFGKAITAKHPALVFYCESVGLIAFGIAWLAAGHVLPGITNDEEKWFKANRAPRLIDLPSGLLNKA
jgi:hypothetical protein